MSFAINKEPNAALDKLKENGQIKSYRIELEMVEITFPNDNVLTFAANSEGRLRLFFNEE